MIQEACFIMADDKSDSISTSSNKKESSTESLDEKTTTDQFHGIKDHPPSDVVDQCRETFKKTAEYLRGELEGTSEDYRLLEKMNKVAICKYSEMKHIALNIGAALQDLSDKYKNLQPYLDQIDQIEESVAALEQAAYNLDQYSKRLEEKFKALEKR